MKRRLLISLLLCLFFSISYAQNIDEATAKVVGATFLNNVSGSSGSRTATGLELIYRAGSHSTNSTARSGDNTQFYIFNTASRNGFVIVSGNESISPILGYSNEKAFDPTNIPPQMAKWLEGYKKEIRYVVTNKIEATREIESSWKELKSGEIKNSSGRTAAVSPLIQTKWDQSPFYNDLCPYDNFEGERVVTGCVATAMAQIMKFWNYPQRGIGSHSYSHSRYGTLAANFGATTYQWNSMPNAISGSNNAIATLMYHCGVGVDMQYGTASTGGSGAYTSKAAEALKIYFGYSSSVQEKLRSNFNEAQWKNLIKTELDAGRPIEYSGSGSGGGHSFVCDGYDNNGLFHFNWGWGGSSDGYFSVNALNPGSLGAGGGTGGFNSQQAIIIGIQPPPGSVNATYDMRLYSSIAVNPTQIIYKAGFTASVDLVNAGTSASNNFSGDYAAKIFNSNNQFVADVEVKTGNSLPFGNHYLNPLTFTYKANVNQDPVTPGDYTIGIYYKPTGSTQWVAFTNGNYQNFVSFKVQGNSTNTLKLFSTITTSTPIVQNKPLSVKLDIVNSGTTTFNGVVSVDIHDSDGTWIRELSSKDISLPANFHYPDGLTFSVPAGLSEAAGTYQLFAWSLQPGGDWTVLGSGSFSNPINIILEEPALPQDIYESNNTVAQAFNLPVSFSGDNINKNTIGSNCHVGSDYDFYKIDLPVGAEYTITPRLQDSYSNTDGETYTLDALFSYSTDGTNWSEAYDDVISDQIKVLNGGTVYFHVAPYFSGEKGTYILDINVSRKITIVQQNQTIVFPSITTKTLGDAAFSLNATTTSSLAPVYTSASDKISISGNTVTMLKAGRTSVTASQTGNASFFAAAPVTQSFCIKPAKPKITITNPNSATIVLSSSAPEGNQWYMNDVLISGATNMTLSTTKVGIYKVQAKVDDCISDFSDGTSLVITGDSEDPSQVVSAYPNPVENYLEIQGLKGDVSGSVVFDMIGRDTSLAFEKTGNRNYRFNTEPLAAGVYMLHIKVNDSVQHFKFVKK